ncbi:MAG: PEP-CTERM sorting domain-containing protein [Desulfobacteraceae bacterium]|nr:PEP-CTERM sorting domain-containing protein [Desulfobacteraceae bacterium]
MKKNLTFLSIFLCVVFLMPFTALAGSYTIDDISFTKAAEVKVELNGSNDPHSSNVGAFTVSFKEFDDVFTAFCIDPDQPISTGQNQNLPVELVPVSTVTGGLEAAWLLQEYGNDMDAGAMQVALWEVVKDTDYDLTSGDFILTESPDTMRNLANEYLNNLAANFDADGLDALFMASKHPEKQDLIYLGTIFGDNTSAVVTPEPGTMFLLCFGILGLVGLRKKIRKS